MYKYFLVACVAVLCATDYSLAMQQESAAYQEESVDQVVYTQLDRIAPYLPKDENDKFLVRSNAINIMTSFAKKYGTSALKEQVDEFIKKHGQSTWGAEWTVYSYNDTPIKEFCDTLKEGGYGNKLSDDDFVDKQINGILIYYDGDLEDADKDNLPKLKQTMLDFVNKKGQKALVEEIEKYNGRCAKLRGTIIERLTAFLQYSINN